MKHLKEPTSRTASGTSFHFIEVKATVNQLRKILGEPEYFTNDGTDKVNFEWERETKSGNVFTIYDWKEYRPIDENEVISWHIGGFNTLDTVEAKEEIKQALKAQETAISNEGLVDIDDADIYLKAEYGEYCAEKLNLQEMPLSFTQWQQANKEMAD